MKNSDPIAATHQWIEQFVIKLNLCPFAAAPMRKDQVRTVLCELTDFDEMIQHFLSESLILIQSPPQKVATSLIVYPNSLENFDDFLDFKVAALSVSETTGLNQFVQLADFHPSYVFADAEEDDPANATNRSPYPTLHLLRVAEMSKAIDSYPDVEQIPQRNIDLLRKLANEK